MKCSEKMDVSSVVPGRNAPKVFEFVEATFDAVAKPVGFGVMANVGYAAALGRDHGRCAQVGDEVAKSVAVIAPVGNHLASGLSVEQSMSLGEIAGLTWREDEAQRSAKRIGQQMDFGCQSSSGTPQSLIFGPQDTIQGQSSWTSALRQAAGSDGPSLLLMT
jgi:hypothetical protein